jgi:ubiquinone/menaquinone biosynthesis C-methylase UbiE
MTEASIDPAHYNFGKYVDIKRWSSYWHQIHETLSLQPRRVLEVGMGTGLYKSALQTLGCPVTTIDINPALKPDHVGSVTALPFEDSSFSVVVAFQVLEHLPYEDFRRSVGEMRRTAAEHVVISLPDARKVWRASVDLGKGEKRWLMTKPRWRPRVHRATGQHLWEINKQGYPVSRIVEDLEAAGLELLREYPVPQNPYHRMFVCRKRVSVAV